MENVDPATAFGEEVAESYDDDVSQRGDELATVALLEQLARGGPHSSSRSAPVGSPCPSRPGGSGSRASISDKPWSPSYAPSRAPRRFRSRSATSLMSRFRALQIDLHSVQHSVQLLTQDAQVRCFENVAAHL